MNVAPAHIACCVPPDERGAVKTPWCHLERGHDGPHVCGEYRWEDGSDDGVEGYKSLD